MPALTTLFEFNTVASSMGILRAANIQAALKPGAHSSYGAVSRCILSSREHRAKPPELGILPAKLHVYGNPFDPREIENGKY